MVSESAPETPTLARTVFIGTDDWEALLAQADQVSQAQLIERAGSLTPDEAINIPYTSGPPGRPKGATPSHRKILNTGYFTNELTNFTHAHQIGRSSGRERVCTTV